MIRNVLFFALALVIESHQIARSEVVEVNRAGPTCEYRFRSCTLIVKISGEITDATVTQLKGIIDKTRRKAAAENLFFSNPLAAELDSRGGSVTAAMAIGRILRQEEMGAYVNAGSVCLSSCVIILAGGAGRTFEGKIGIHRPYLEVPSGEVSSENVQASYRKVLQDLRAYFREMNVVEGLADAMLRINPENIRFLRKIELDEFGLTDVDPIALETYELGVAKRNGLDRQEYMRRKKMAESQCGGPASLGTDCYRNILKTGIIPAPIDFSKYGTPAK